MSSVDKLFKLADRFARKISLGQKVAGDFQDALQAAGLWDKAAEVAPMINAARIPDSASIATVINVDKQLNCRFSVTATVQVPPPPAPTADPEEKAAYAKAVAEQKAATAGAAKLSQLLAAKYGAAMKAALTKAGLSVTDTMDIRWLTF